MRRRTGKQLKRLAAIVLAAGMMTGAAMPVYAVAPETTSPSFVGETKAIDSADKTMDQEAVVWATVTNEALKQLKVTLPIRLDFVIFKNQDPDAGDTTTKFLSGDYEIIVGGDSEVGVQLEKITISKPTNGKWDLIASSEVSSNNDFHKVSMKLAGQELIKGENKIENFTVDVGNSKTLSLEGSVNSNAAVSAAAAERAFLVTYTISQYTAPESPTE